jgi:hypothetical protein
MSGLGPAFWWTLAGGKKRGGAGLRGDRGNRRCLRARIDRTKESIRSPLLRIDYSVVILSNVGIELELEACRLAIRGPDCIVDL